MNIDEMQAGREMDALIGKTINATPKIIWRAMNQDESAYYMWFERRGDAEEWHQTMTSKYPNHPYSAEGGHMVETEVYKRYSEDIAAAWEAVKKMGELGYTCHIEWKGADRVYSGTAEVAFVKCIYTEGHAVGKAPESICRAALKALGVTP